MYEVAKKSIEFATEKLIGINNPEHKKDGNIFSLFSLTPEFINEDEIRQKSKNILLEMGYEKDYGNISYTQTPTSTIYKIALYDRNCDDFGDVCCNEAIIIFVSQKGQFSKDWVLN